MDRQQVAAFLEKITDTSDKRVLRALGLAHRELEVFVAALSALTEESGVTIPNLNGIIKVIGLKSPYIQNLKKKGFITAGLKRGEWKFTERAEKKVAWFLGQKLDGKTPEAEKPRKEGSARKKAGRKAKPPRKSATQRAKRQYAVDADLDKMSVSDILTWLTQTESEIKSLEERRTRIKTWAKDKLSSLK
jgi:hypothetical protein